MLTEERETVIKIGFASEYLNICKLIRRGK